MSIIFFKTKGKDFWGDAVAVLPLGSSSVAIAASPGIVPCRAPSTPRRRCFFFFFLPRAASEKQEHKNRV